MRSVVFGAVLALSLSVGHGSYGAQKPVQPSPPSSSSSHHSEQPPGSRQLGPAFITYGCGTTKTVDFYVETTLGVEDKCFDGTGTLINVNLGDINRMRTASQVDGIITYNLHNANCDTEPGGYGEIVLYLDPNLDVPFTDLNMKLCSIELY